jgi:actin-related protein 6
MNNERFTIPELLFHPSDIGIKEMGIPEAIVDSISSCHQNIQQYLYNNILIIGGNSQFKGFKERM